MAGTSKGTFWGIGLSGLIGAFIGAGGMFYSQKQASTAENQYFMELDQLRHSAVLEDRFDFEEKLENLKLLESVRKRGFRVVFENNLKRDIEELETSIDRIAEAKKHSDAAAEQARIDERAKAKAAAQARKERAIQTNPLIFEICGIGTNKICP